MPYPAEDEEEKKYEDSAKKDDDTTRMLFDKTSVKDRSQQYLQSKGNNDEGELIDMIEEE